LGFGAGTCLQPAAPLALLASSLPPPREIRIAATIAAAINAKAPRTISLVRSPDPSIGATD
jgi:hypothetical protein